MLAKLIVTGATRQEAIERARRALGEYVVAGFPTVIPFHQAILDNPAFVGDEDGFGVYTRWIEEEWDGELPSTPATDEDEDADDAILHPLATFGDYAGDVVAVAYYDGGGYWDCGVCQEVNIGRGVVFEGDRIQH